jgi:hypothetical protein
MKCGLVGASYQQRSLPFDAQRTVNMYAVIDQQGSDVAALYGRAGLKLFGTPPAPAVGRCSFTASNGRVFNVIGADVFELLADGSMIDRGTIDQSIGLLTMAENGVQLAVCDGTSLYILNYSTNVFTKVVTANLPTAATVTFINGYFVVNRSIVSGIYQISAPYDGLTWAALDFATAESSPDSLLRVLNVYGLLWLFGERTIEIKGIAAAGLFPFRGVDGGNIEVGTIGSFSPIAIDNSVIWVGQDKYGSGVVYRAEGFSPVRISTDAIEKIIQSAPTPQSLYTYAYQEEGHAFVVITGGGMETSLVYDLTTQLWFESAYTDDFGNYSPHLSAYTVFGFNKQLALSRIDGKVYEQSLDYHDDDGRERICERIFTHLIDESKEFVYNSLTVGFESGVGTQTGQGVDPEAILYLSRDGGRTYSNGMSAKIGKAGEFLKRTVFRRLGQARIMTFRLRISDPVPVRITGAYFNT